MVREVKDRHGVDFLLAPRRLVLDEIVLEAARAAGARVRTGVSVDDVVRDHTGRVTGVRAHDGSGSFEVMARHVVGADGLGSRIARAVEASMTVVRSTTGAAQYAYHLGEWPAIEYHLADEIFAGVFPTHGDQACVWVCAPERVVRDHRARVGRRGDALLSMLAEAAPGLAARADVSTRRSPVRGMLRMPNHVRQASGPGWALVGDAGHHRDAITGHGISDAFRDAELLADALDTALRDPACEADALTAYGLERDRMARDVFDITCELATFPAQVHFLELQRRLAKAIDAMAGELSTRRLPRAATAAA
jgi:flavin-dependent dehydrogenase